MHIFLIWNFVSSSHTVSLCATLLLSDHNSADVSNTCDMFLSHHLVNVIFYCKFSISRLCRLCLGTGYWG